MTPFVSKVIRIWFYWCVGGYTVALVFSALFK